MIDGDIEKALNLICVQVHRKNSVRACGSDYIRDEFCGDGISCLGFSVLTSVTEIRHNRRYSSGGSPPERVDHYEKFHEVLVDRSAGGLNYEYVPASYRFSEMYARFTIRKMSDFNVAQRNLQFFCDCLGKLSVGIACKKFYLRAVCYHCFLQN